MCVCVCVLMMHEMRLGLHFSFFLWMQISQTVHASLARNLYCCNHRYTYIYCLLGGVRFGFYSYEERPEGSFALVPDRTARIGSDHQALTRDTTTPSG